MNKASGGDGIPAELLQILKDDAVKVLHSICQQIGKTKQWPRRRKWQPTPVFLPGESHEQRILAGYSPWGFKSQT